MRALRFLGSVFLFFASLHLSVSGVLVEFQVTQPPPVPKDTQQCTIEILQHDFANSYGNAKIVEYAPPIDCGPVGSWAAITLNFTVTSNGTQFDRLGIFTFQNVEIWRTSTPEPRKGDGIIWTYIKDVTRYKPLFEETGSFILQLDNLIEPGLDGIYSTVLHATFFASSPIHPPVGQSNLIIPIASLSKTTGGEVSVPPTFSLNVTFPRNAVQIYAELYASGNGDEEFWYFNTANEFLSKLPPNTAFGDGPFREVRLLVDGQVAGAAYPYATIFTGGIIPSAWRPITSYGALDLPTYFLDLTSFVPILTDGNPHTISLDVASAENNHTINQNWYLSAVLQVFTDSSPNPTTGKITQYSVEPFSKTTTVGSVGENGDLNVTVSATRELHIESTIISGSGMVNNVVWVQSLEYTNVQNYLSNSTIQNVCQTASGTMSSTHNGSTVVFDNFAFPLAINMTLSDEGSIFQAVIDHSYNRDLLQLPIVVRSNIQEHQLASGIIVLSPNGIIVTETGTSNNTFAYSDQAGNTFNRVVDAAFDVITRDQQSGTLAPSPAAPEVSQSIVSFLSGFGDARLPGGRKMGLKIDI